MILANGPKSVLSASKTRRGVLEGQFDNAVWATDLGRVMDGSVPRVYGSGEAVFRNSDPSPAFGVQGEIPLQRGGVTAAKPMDAVDQQEASLGEAPDDKAPLVALEELGLGEITVQ